MLFARLLAIFALLMLAPVTQAPGELAYDSGLVDVEAPFEALARPILDNPDADDVDGLLARARTPADLARQLSPASSSSGRADGFRHRHGQPRAPPFVKA